MRKINLANRSALRDAQSRRCTGGSNHGSGRLCLAAFLGVVVSLNIGAGCLTFGGDTGGGGGSPTPSPETRPPLVDVTGSWTVTETIVSGDCDDVGTRMSYTVRITQTGSHLTAVTPYGTMTGTISGRTLNLSGRQVESEGVSDVSWTGIEVALDGESASGNSSWVFTSNFYPEDNCSGTTFVSATRD